MNRGSGIVALAAVLTAPQALAAETRRPSGETWGFELIGATARQYGYPGHSVTAPPTGAFAEIGVIEFAPADAAGTGRAGLKITYSRPGFESADWLSLACGYAMDGAPARSVKLTACTPLGKAAFIGPNVEVPAVLAVPQSGARGEAEISATVIVGSTKSDAVSLHGTAWVLREAGGPETMPQLVGRYVTRATQLYDARGTPRDVRGEMDLPDGKTPVTMFSLVPPDGWFISRSASIFLQGKNQPMTVYYRPAADGTGIGYGSNPTDPNGVPIRLGLVLGPAGAFFVHLTTFSPGAQHEPSDPLAISLVAEGRSTREP